MTLAQGTAQAAPEARLLDGAWDRHDETSLRHVDHTVWDRLLRTYVAIGADGINRFRYQAVGAGDRVVLDAYINAMARVQVGSLTRAEQISFWINLYNALTIKVVLDQHAARHVERTRVSGCPVDCPSA